MILISINNHHDILYRVHEEFLTKTHVGLRTEVKYI